MSTSPRPNTHTHANVREHTTVFVYTMHMAPTHILEQPSSALDVVERWGRRIPGLQDSRHGGSHLSRLDHGLQAAERGVEAPLECGHQLHAAVLGHLIKSYVVRLLGWFMVFLLQFCATDYWEAGPVIARIMSILPMQILRMLLISGIESSKLKLLGVKRIADRYPYMSKCVQL